MKPKAGSLKTSVIDKPLSRLIKKKETQITNIIMKEGHKTDPTDIKRIR